MRRGQDRKATSRHVAATSSPFWSPEAEVEVEVHAAETDREEEEEEEEEEEDDADEAFLELFDLPVQLLLVLRLFTNLFELATAPAKAPRLSDRVNKFPCTRGISF